MNKILFSLIVLSMGAGSCHGQPKAARFEPIAVVELFTSEGCSSCPPADELLSRLAADAEKEHKKIFPLSYHVDYWDRLGWKDPFSSSLYSQRQRQYAQVMDLSSVYTPQIVINGIYQAVGSDESKINAAMAKAMKENTVASFTALSVSSREGKKISLSYNLNGDLMGCELHFLLVSKHESSAVKRGENSGRKLDHTNVVRQFITTTAAAKGEVSFDLSALSSGDMMIVALLQHKDDLNITAAAAVKL